MIDLKNRKVEFFRAHIDPGCCPMPKNAVSHMDVKTMELIPGTGIHLMNKLGVEFIIPFANCQTIKLKPEEPAPEQEEKKKK